MSDDGEMLSVGQYVDRVIGLLEKAENIRLDAQRTAQNAVAAGDLARLRDDPSSVLGSAEELNTLKYQFDAAARPLVQVAYGLDIDAAPLDDFIRTGKPDLVGKAIGVLRRIQGEALKRQVPAIQQHPHADKIEQIRRGMDAVFDQQRQYEAGLERVSRAVQDVTPISETMKQAYLDAMAEHEQSKPARWELESLVKLAERKLWPVDELPEDIDADVLRCLDERGWVEARYVIMQNQARYPGDPTPPAPSHGEWDSPLKRPRMVGSWDSLLAKRERNERDHPGEVRVSEIGKAILARVRREVAALPEPSNSSTENAEPTHSPDFTSVDWFGTRYTFSKGNQAQAVRVLWEAWTKGEHSLSQETVGERIESSADRFEMRKTFRRRKTKGNRYEPHPAWGTMIQQDGKGCFRLVRPKSD